ncbi:putative PEPTIDE SYNTHETASE NRP domain protein [Mycobacterium xenopi 4042]|uniref:Putative PEPTIDE SYNTHETASE NRP domain protein n=1 Tax=Mycobacterium xenopi 4042 TaxID=1299334 RepID=X8AQX4_MYCXE|nr:putative PEPTIDE SYNTHETASE NRP domain protein [Mycobacterium xenopi 4042]
MFGADHIETLLERFARLLTAMTAEPTRPLASIDVLDATEHARLDEVGNRMVLTGSAFTPASIPELFAAQVERTPHAVALSDGQRSMTYRQLDQAANRLAHLLAAHGAAPASLWPAAVAVGTRGHGDPGGAQNRGRLPTHRPRASTGAHRLHGRRRQPRRCPHHRSAGQPPRPTPPARGRRR